MVKADKQVAFATAVALTKTAIIAKGEIEEEMARVFDRPTKFTMKSLRIIPAKKDKLFAAVDMKNEADKAAPATTWLNPQIDGGGRRDKASERSLRGRGILPAGKFIAPGRNAKLDRFGNLSRGAIIKALSGIGGLSEQGYTANASSSTRSKRKGNAKTYFVMKRGSTPIGIAERTSRNRMQVLIAFTRRPSYSRRLNFYGVGNKAIDKNLADEFRKAYAKAIATAR